MTIQPQHVSSRHKRFERLMAARGRFRRYPPPLCIPVWIGVQFWL